MWAGRGAGPPGPVGVAAAVLLLLLLLCGVGPACGSEDIVVGCGGFVKSDVEINYSLIEVSARPARRRPRAVTPGRSLSLSGPPRPGARPRAASASRRMAAGSGAGPRRPESRPQPLEP